MRILLKNDITLCREDGSCVKFHITSHIGSGASCVVYRATCDDNTEHLLKEYYPRSLDLERDSDGTLIIPEHKKESFEIGLQRFRDGNERQKKVRLSEELKNFTSNVQGYFYGNGTEYIDMTVSAGRTYDQVESESLYDLLRRMKVLAQVIEVYHNQGLLHLDIKPENIYIRPETETVEDVMLFDFDSVIEESRKKEYSALSYTKLWAASEQLLCKRESICKATDLFAIGEMIFFRIFGRHSTSMERRSFAKYEFDHNAEIFKNVNPKVFPLLKDLLRHTICNRVEKRYQSAGELISALDKLIPLANPKEHFLISNLPTPKSFFIGRDKEIEDIHQKLQENNILFLHGIGGIGKSELAKQYAKKYRSEYDTIVFAPYITDIVSMIADDAYVHINHFERFADEKTEDYYERKLRKIKALISDKGARVLFLVDNFDAADDPHTNVFTELNCRVLVTSRVDFADAYAQLELSAITNPIGIFNEYYKKAISDMELNTVNEIIVIIGGHTMTVELLAKQMMASRITPEQMLKKLKFTGINDSGKEKVRSVKDGHQTTQSTFEHIKELFDLSDLDEGEIYVLTNLSLIPHTGISAQLFKEWCEIDNFNTINCLVSEGWVRKDEEKDYISLHPVVADVSSVIIKQSAVICETLFKKIIDTLVGRNVPTEELFSLILLTKDIGYKISQYDLTSETGFKTLEAISNSIKGFGFFDDALYFRKYVLDKSLELYESDDFRLANAYNSLGLLYEEKHCFDEAEDCYLNTLEVDIAIDNYQGMATGYCNLGRLYSIREMMKEAQICYEKSLYIHNELYGEDSIETATLHHNIGCLMRKQGQYDIALSHCSKALNLMIDNYGASHNSLIATYWALGTIYQDQGDFDSAEMHYKKSLSIALDSYGDNHKYITDSCMSLGSLHYERGELDIAKDYFDKVFEMRKILYGDDNVFLAYPCVVIGDILAEQQEYTQAEGYYQKALDLRLNTYGENHSEVAEAYKKLGDIHMKMDHYDISEKFYLRSLSIFTSTNEDYSDIFSHLGKLNGYLASLELVKAVSDDNFDDLNLDAFFSRDSEIFHQNKKEIAEIYVQLGLLYVKWNNIVKSNSCFEKAIQIYETLPIDSKEMVCLLYHAMSENCKMLRLYIRAFIYWCRSKR